MTHGLCPTFHEQHDGKPIFEVDDCSHVKGTEIEPVQNVSKLAREADLHRVELQARAILKPRLRSPV